MPVTRIEFRRIKGRGDGWWQDNYETVLGVLFFVHNENQSTIKIQTYVSGSPPKSDGADETGDASRILVWGTPSTTGRGGHMRIASIRTQTVSGQNSRRAANVEREVGQLAIGYLRRRVYTETVGGISHGSVPC